MKREKPIKVAASALAELYIWSAVQEILEGSTRPRSASGQKAATKVIGICQRECRSRLSEYDAALAREAQP